MPACRHVVVKNARSDSPALQQPRPVRAVARGVDGQAGAAEQLAGDAGDVGVDVGADAAGRAQLVRGVVCADAKAVHAVGAETVLQGDDAAAEQCGVVPGDPDLQLGAQLESGGRRRRDQLELAGGAGPTARD